MVAATKEESEGLKALTDTYSKGLDSSIEMIFPVIELSPCAKN
jgi:hypothetical protein